jgi:GH24 family phage-related lysozyme (muramidase)
MRHINERGIEIVKSFEGISLEPYLCPVNFAFIRTEKLVNNATQAYRNF